MRAPRLAAATARGMSAALLLIVLPAAAQPPVEPGSAAAAPGPPASASKFRSAEDGWFDVSGFLDEKYGFLPIAIPITEPAVGYGAAGGLVFIDKPLGNSEGEYDRPDITFLGGLATENGTWGAAAADLRQWSDDRVQTLAAFIHVSMNLDFYGIGEDDVVANHPLRYGLDPTGGLVQGKLRLGDSRVWAGLGYGYFTTRVTFDEPAGTPGLPAFERDTDVGGLVPSLTFDTRDNFFTPTRGTYLDGSAAFFSSVLGGDDEFQRTRVIAMQFVPLSTRFFLGLRGEAAAVFGDAPFYLHPFLYLRGAPAIRYQGEEVAQIETELRWQFWERFSLVGFAGTGATWNDFEDFAASQSIVTGGGGFRYELARKYGIHMGLDVAFDRDNTAVYL
ncbi:MAG: BamA/TamA family outer membrane protein, partial [bacterium]